MVLEAAEPRQASGAPCRQAPRQVEARGILWLLERWRRSVRSTAVTGAGRLAASRELEAPGRPLSHWGVLARRPARMEGFRALRRAPMDADGCSSQRPHARQRA